jgi:trehalose 6-phosphate synthase
VSTEINNSGGADFIVVANRLPVDLEKLPDGTERWKHSPGGLVSALAPFLQRNSGAWVGWPGVPDVDVDKFSDDGIWLHPVRLSADEVRDYYEGFSNATLWPLYHDVVATPVFDRGWWDSYVKVNRRFADECAKIAADGAIVWVQDYQLQLVPAMLREQRPDLRIGFFLHIPFPPTELFMQLPWRAEIIRGLLGADLVGFHRPGGAQNYLWLARRLIGLEPSRGAVGVRTRPGVVQVGDRSVRVGAFPISIEASGLDAMARSREVTQRARQLRSDLGNPRKIILGVDRLDYTKGIDVRLYALQELLSEGRIDPSEVVMVQLATPSRERVEHYQRMRGEIEQVVSRINGEFARVGHPVVHYLHHAGHAGARRHEPGLQGVRRLPARPRRRARAERVRRRSRRADQRVPRQPARPGRGQERDGGRTRGGPGGGQAADARAAQAGAHPRRRPLGQVVPRRVVPDTGAAHPVAGAVTSGTTNHAPRRAIQFRSAAVCQPDAKSHTTPSPESRTRP